MAVAFNTLGSSSALANELINNLKKQLDAIGSAINDCCKTGDLSQIEQLLEALPLAFRPQIDVNTAMLIGAENGHVHIVQFMLTNNADINSTDQKKNNANALLLACEQCHHELIEFLLNHKINVNHRDACGNSALHLAVESQSIEIVKLLIAAGAEVNHKNMNGNSVLHFALNRPRPARIDLLNVLTPSDNQHISHQPPVKFPLPVSNKNDTASPSPEKPPSIEEQQIEVIKLLVSSKVNVNAFNENGESTLHLASRNGQNEIVKYLIANRADVNVKNKFGASPLHKALLWKRFEVAKTLISNKANPNQTNKEGISCLRLAEERDYADIVQLIKNQNIPWKNN